MLINDKLRNLARHRKLRRTLKGIYLQRNKLNKHVPLWQEGADYLSISPRGFYYHNSKEKNIRVKYAGGLLIHLPLTNRHYFVYYTPSRYTMIPRVNIKEILDLFENIDIKRVKNHFDYDLEKRT